MPAATMTRWEGDEGEGHESAAGRRSRALVRPPIIARLRNRGFGPVLVKRPAPTGWSVRGTVPSAARPSTRSVTRSRWCSHPGDSRTSVSDSPSVARARPGSRRASSAPDDRSSALTPPRLSPSAKNRRDDTNDDHLVDRAVELERDHAAEPGHLSSRHVVARMRSAGPG